MKKQTRYSGIANDIYAMVWCLADDFLGKFKEKIEIPCMKK